MPTQTIAEDSFDYAEILDYTEFAIPAEINLSEDEFGWIINE